MPAVNVSAAQRNDLGGPDPDLPKTRVVSRFRDGQLHRTVALLALITLFIGTIDSFDGFIWSQPIAGIAILTGYAMALGLGVMAFVVRRPAGLLAVDIGILTCTLLVRMPEFLLSLGTPQGKPNAPYANDEGALVDLAGRSLLHGHDPYAVVWAGAHDSTQSGITATMGGGVVDHFDYPPVTAIASAAARELLPHQPSAAIASLVGLLATTILLFVLLPAPWRSAATMVCLGLGLFLMPFARQGYPETVALPFVVLAINRWSRIGIDGRLGGLGIVSALGLGLACASQQMAWFLVPFLAVGLLLLRAGDQGWRTASWLLSRYGAIAAGGFAAINLPFMVWNFPAWRTAMMTPLIARLVPHGQGLIGISYDVFNGSGRLHAFSYAAVALAIGLLASYALFIRTLGPAMVVLPWSIFFLSIRASDKYYYMMAPIWLISLATVRHRDFARAWTLPLLGRGILVRRWCRAAIAVLLFVPTITLTTIAIASPQPLRMSVLSVTPSKSWYTKTIAVLVTNRSSGTIAPHFALSNSVKMSRFWIRKVGPPRLKPGQSAEYVLEPSVPTARRSLLGPHIELRAVSAYPETLSSVALPMLAAPGVPRQH